MNIFVGVFLVFSDLEDVNLLPQLTALGSR